VASYSAVINVSVSGQAALDKLEGSARSIQTLIQGIKQQKNIFDQAVGSEKTRELKKNLDSLVTSFAAAQDGARQFEVVVGGKTRKVNMYSKTLAGLSHQLGTFRAIADNATVGTDRFVNSLIAANKVSNELARTQARAMTAGTGVTGTPQNVQEVLALGRAIPDTLEGLTFYKGKLEELLSTLRLTSNEFRAVEEASAAVDVRLGNARLTGQTSAITPAAGPASRIDTVASYEKRAALAQKVADLEYKQLLTGQQITQSKIKEAQKTELINRLDQASKALAEGKLDVAKRLTNELRNQRIVYERGKKTSSPVELETRRNNILNSTQMLEQRALQLKTKGVNVDKQINSLQALQNRLRAQGVNLTEQDLGLIDEELNGLRNVLKLENAILGTRKAQANATKAAAAPGEQEAKNKNAMLQNALIGGAFPLLFGGGAGAVVGGFAGGFIPGNPMMSIVTSALGTMVDQFVASVAEMGVAVTSTSGTFDLMREKALFSSTAVEDQAIALEEQGKVTELANLLTQDLAKSIGGEGVRALQALGDETNILTKEWNLLTAQLFALVAGPLADFINALNTVLGGVTTENRLNTLRNEATPAQQKRLAEITDEERGGVVRNVRGGGQEFIAGPETTQVRQEILKRATAEGIVPAAPPGRVTSEDRRTITAPRPKADRAARDAERERERVAELVRSQALVTAELKRQEEFSAKIFAAELAKDPMLARRLKGEQQLVEWGYETANLLEKEESIQGQLAIARAQQAKQALILQKTTQDLVKLENDRVESANKDIAALEKELEIKNALTQVERDRLRIEYEMQVLSDSKKFDQDQLNRIEDLKKQIAAPTLGVDLIRKQIGTLSDELLVLTDVGTQVTAAAASIGDAFGASFKGIVDGSMTAQQGLATFFKSVADMFLDMAAQIIAAWIKMAILNTIVKIFGGGLTTAASPEVGAIGQGSSIYAAAEGAYWPGGFQAFADGGLVTKPTMGLIGEGGESEYVIPASKMQSAMSRYSRGARGESVLAGGGASSESGAPAAGGPMTIDVRYSVERINDVEYVTASQFQAGMLQAAQQGAAQGEQRTLRRLQQSPSTRKRVGV
jgi:soluble cytochrome b562